MKKKSKLKKGSLWLILVPLFVSLVVFFGGNYFIKSGARCANSKTCKSDLSLNVDNNAVGIFGGRKIIPPKIDLARDIVKPTILGTSVPKGEKHIYVNLSTQTLYAYQGSTLIMEALISSGKWGRTPVGNFNIWEKLRSTRMSGGSGSDAYDLPNVPYVMYFYNDFGLHGAYWHNNFGHEMSHGCVNMRPVDAEALFSWADAPTSDNPGTTVSVCSRFSPPNLCVQEGAIN